MNLAEKLSYGYVRRGSDESQVDPLLETGIGPRSVKSETEALGIG